MKNSGMLEEIKAKRRHFLSDEHYMGCGKSTPCPGPVGDVDVDWLIAEVECLSSEVEAWKRAIERYQDEISIPNAKEVDRLRAALLEIAEHDHNHTGECTVKDEDIVPWTPIGGCISGHRCAAEIARKALEGGDVK